MTLISFKCKTLDVIKNPENKKIQGSWFILFYYALMEWLQFLGYLFAYTTKDGDRFKKNLKCLTCKTKKRINLIITISTWTQISFQPFFMYLSTVNYNTHSDKLMNRMMIFLCIRDYLIPFLPGKKENNDKIWFSGNKWKTFLGKYHLAWTFPFKKSSYYMPSVNHFILMFSPFLIQGKILEAGALFITGPLLAEVCTNWNNYEAGAVWCFQSICQLFMNVAILSKGTDLEMYRPPSILIIAFVYLYNILIVMKKKQICYFL